MNGYRALTFRWMAVNLALAALLTGLLLGNRYVLQPRLAEAMQQDREREKLQAELKAARAELDGLLAQKARLGSEAARLQTFREKGLPGALQAQADMQRVIHRTLEAAGLKTLSVRYAAADAGEKKNLRRLTADFTVMGSYATLKALLAAVEQAPEFVLIDDFGFAPQPAAPGQPGGEDNLALQLKLSVFYQNNRPREDRRGA
jgi:Tfp pilus assembly protein PilO